MDMFILKNFKVILLALFFLFSNIRIILSQTIEPDYFRLIHVGDSLYYSGEYEKSMEYYNQTKEFNAFAITFFYMSYSSYMIGDTISACQLIKKSIEKGFEFTDNEYVAFLEKQHGCITDYHKLILEKNYYRQFSSGYKTDLIENFQRALKLDQKYRQKYIKTEFEWEEQKRLDSLNMVFLDSILETDRKWPGLNEIGIDNDRIPILIAIHSDRFITFQKKCLKYAFEALLENNISKGMFAMLYDHIKVNEGSKQLFGTQTEVIDGENQILPLEYPELVDIYRKYFDLPSLNQYLNDLNVK